MTFKEELAERVQNYFDSVDALEGQTAPILLYDFVIEKFCQVRNYPKSYTAEQIESDMRGYLSTMAMAVVDLYAKTGAWGEKSHTESGIARVYENAYVSASLFNDVLPMVDFF